MYACGDTESMAKKKDKFREGDFNQIPPKIFDKKTGDLLSFKIEAPELPPIFKDVCEIHIVDNLNLNIIHKKGRQPGTNIFYNLDNIYNYQSQSQRYDRAVNLGVLPASIRKENGKTCYLFCSPTAEGGFYEVCVDEKDLFLKFTVNQLFIVCPRPFNLNDLSGLDTNAEWVKWTQLQGRGTIIFPNDASAATLNPVISIIGNRTPKDPPILLLAEAEGSSTILDILAIDTTITDRLYEAHGADYETLPPDYSIPCRFRLVPQNANTGQCGASASSAFVSWFLPELNRADILGFMPQVNNNGVWQNLLPDISGISLYLAEAGKSYRVLTYYSIFDNQVIADSCVLRFNALPTIATDEATNAYGSDGKFESRQYLVRAINQEVEDILDFNVYGSDGRFESRQYLVTALVVDAYDVFGDTSSVYGHDGKFECSQYALDSLIIG
jgi:hypothetical protein